MVIITSLAAARKAAKGNAHSLQCQKAIPAHGPADSAENGPHAEGRSTCEPRCRRQRGGRAPPPGLPGTLEASQSPDSWARSFLGVKSLVGPAQSPTSSSGHTSLWPHSCGLFKVSKAYVLTVSSFLKTSVASLRMERVFLQILSQRA